MTPKEMPFDEGLELIRKKVESLGIDCLGVFFVSVHHTSDHSTTTKTDFVVSEDADPLGILALWQTELGRVGLVLATGGDVASLIQANNNANVKH